MERRPAWLYQLVLLTDAQFWVPSDIRFDTADIGSFNGLLRDECLNLTWFGFLDRAQNLVGLGDGNTVIADPT